MKTYLLCVLSLFLVWLVGCSPQVSSKTETSAPEKATTRGGEQELLTLIGQLDSSNPEKVMDALEAIEKIGPSASAAIPAVLRKFDDRNIRVRLAAKSALKALGEKAAEAIIESPTLYKSEEFPGLIMEHGKTIVPAIIQELENGQNLEKRVSILMGLMLLETKGNAAVPTLEKLKKNETDQRMVMLYGSAIEVLVNGLEGAQKNSEKKLQELKTRAKQLDQNVEDELQEFRDRLDKSFVIDISLETPESRRLMRSWNNDLDKALPDLEKMLGSTQKDRANACVILATFGQADEANISVVGPLIKKLTTDEVQTIRCFAALYAQEFGDKKDYTSIFLQSVEEPSSREEVMAAFVGLIKGKKVVKDQDQLLKLEVMVGMPTIPQQVRTLVAMVLIQSGKGKYVVDYAISLVEDRNPENQQTGVALLVKIGGEEAKKGIPALQALKRKNQNEAMDTVLELAILAIQGTEKEDKGDLEKIKKHAMDDDSDLQTSVFMFDIPALESEKKQELLPWLLNCIVKGSPRMQDLAVSALSKYGKDAEPAMETVLALLKYSLAKGKGDWQFQLSSLLGEIGDEEAAPILFDVYSQGERAASLSAQLALGKLGSKAEAMVPKLLALAKKPAFQETALSIVEEIGVIKSPEDVQAVVDILTESEGIVSITACQILAKHASPKEAIPRLSKLVVGTERTAARLGLVALYQMSDREPAALQAIRDIRPNISDPGVKQWADEVLEKPSKKGGIE